MEEYDELKSLIKDGKIILFVGAGVSAGLGLPNWRQLISHLAKELGYDERLFCKYGDSLALAEFYVICKNNMEELKKWMKINWRVSDEAIRNSKILDYIVKNRFPIIYTTNYDQCLERAFDLSKKKYKKIVDVSDLINIDPGETQIVKFHGDTDRDGPIVLTESSYFDRLDFESPLDIKLRADMLGKSILFIGYSLSDINIRMMLYKIDKLWKNSDYENKPVSFVFLTSPNPVQEQILHRRGIRAIIGGEIDKEKSLINFLERLSMETSA